MENYVRCVVVFMISLGVMGCVDPVKPIRAWSAQTAASASVATVAIDNQSSNATEEGLQLLKTAVEQKVATCAKGSTKYEMQIRVDNYKVGSPTLALLLHDSHEISAGVKLVESDTNTVVAEYYVQERTMGGGLIGAAKLASGAKGISADFADRTCERVFMAK